MKPILPIVAVMLALAGCGSRQALKPEMGQSLPVKPATAPTQPTVVDLLAPSQAFRPSRSDELLKQSEKREDDRFDLPPAG